MNDAGSLRGASSETEAVEETERIGERYTCLLTKTRGRPLHNRRVCLAVIDLIQPLTEN